MGGAVASADAGGVMGDDYTCEACGGTFAKGWSDAEAREESARLFPGEDDMAIVCDDCFQRFYRWLLSEGA